MFHKRQDVHQSPLTTTKAKAIIIGLGSLIPAMSPFKKLLQIGRIALVQRHPTWFLLLHLCRFSALNPCRNFNKDLPQVEVKFLI
jgi:hypothetical protein